MTTDQDPTLDQNQQPRPQGRHPRYLYPFLFALVLVIGIGLGMGLKKGNAGKMTIFSRSDYNRMDEILNYINSRYVDTINTVRLFDMAIEEVFRKLDPHSMYISAEELARLSEPLQGHFEGIGVEFFLVEDTITVVATLPGGPSQTIGILAGDRIVRIEDTVVAGIGIENQDVVKRLKGPKGSKVRVSVLRAGDKDLHNFTITRGAVLLSSIDAAYLIQDDIGYIKLTRFSTSTGDDMAEAITRLKKQGMKRLVLDLRDNGGGYLDQATRVADEFLSGNKKIVYTEGRMYPQKVYRAGRPGTFEEGELVIMLNENSASASEILAGAIQDWERGTVVGRRSYGKALVQEEIPLQDGSAMRLTVARYYTPKGRSIQRNYDNGSEAYRDDHFSRILSEYENVDSFHVSDTTKYGIYPDIYIPWDTSEANRTMIALVNRGHVPRFTYRYFAHHAPEFRQYNSFQDFDRDFEVSDDVFSEFVAYTTADTSNLGRHWATHQDRIALHQDDLKLVLKAYFAKQLFYYDGLYPLMNRLDRELQEALRAFPTM